MSGSFMEQSFGDGIQCAGSTLTITPFLNGVDTHKLPYEPYCLFIDSFLALKDRN